MKIRIGYVFALIIGFVSCSKKSDKLPAIPFDDISAISLKYKIPLDSVVERTEIIRFTTDTSLIIGNISEVVESENNLFVIADNKILEFTKSGEFIQQIGKQGKGPGEYLSPQTLDVDKVDQQIYVMDYFGRKMLRYNFDGSFYDKFDLPENFNINGFSLYQGKILYTSVANSVIPELYIYDQDNNGLTQISSPERKMAAGEALMSANFILGNPDHPLLFHYFNDTVFAIENNQLIPAYLLLFGNLKIKFEELNIENGKKANAPRAQVYNMAMGNRFTFIQYGVSRFNGKTGQTFLTGLYKNDCSAYSPNVTLVSNENPLYTIQSGKSFFKGNGNTLLIPVSALDVLKAAPGFDISENDNPILLKYYLR